MDVKEQRTKIAEACGWKDCGYHHLHGMSWACVVLSGLRPEDNSSTYYCPLLDYLSDLNAMHEAEKVLTWEQSGQYNEILSCDVLSTSEHVYHATAQQRAEAFLRTLKLWK